jgi:hypothetical protein
MLGPRRQELIKHEVATLVEQRGCVELIDHDELRHDPVMEVLTGKLEAHREDCAQAPPNQR